MITYVDTSTLLKLLIEEEGSERAALIWDTTDAVASATLVIVEGRAALAAAHRGGRLDRRRHRRAVAAFTDLVDGLNLVQATEDLFDTAAGLAEDEHLRGYDAVHLAAALKVRATVLSSADTDLCDAATRCGLHVANPLDPAP